MKKNKAIAVLVCMALLLGLLTFTAAVGFRPHRNRFSEKYHYWTGLGRRCEHYLPGSGR